MVKNVKTHCNNCSDNTNHLVLFKESITTFEEYDDERHPPTKEINDYMVIECKGCDTISFLHRIEGDRYTNNEDEDEPIYFNYPESEHGTDFVFLSDKEQKDLPSQIRQLYDELGIVFSFQARLLAGVGLRMLVEAICLEQNIQGKNLKIKIEKLHEKGLISQNEIPILHKLREIGNSSAHEIKSLTIDKLEYALDIINHILKSVYVLPKINKKLKLK